MAQTGEEDMEVRGLSISQEDTAVYSKTNILVIIREEPLYRADPEDDATDAFQISKVAEWHTYGDVEGVTLVEGPTCSQGFVLVIQQGVSAYSVHRRAAPHESMEKFTVAGNFNRGVDAVSNTDGIAAVGTAAGYGRPYALVVVHDDANGLSEGGTSDDTGFKLQRRAEMTYWRKLTRTRTQEDSSTHAYPRKVRYS
ncbi:Phytase [Apiospora phragmitis]|uniref:Phytase n=1 Tax=Apiospora phragmitis TaxID=2905665 RepID=A0ABR1VG95_9PEZI